MFSLNCFALVKRCRSGVYEALGNQRQLFFREITQIYFSVFSTMEQWFDLVVTESI